MNLVLSLFPGIDLLGMAFEMEGFTVVSGPDVIFGRDIRNFHPPAGKFDGICGGPPCQSFSSLARLVSASGHEPRFGNLIPEFERCVREAQPAWFLMEEVPKAPVPVVSGYAVKDFLLDNAWVCGEDGYGQEQTRVRRFSFGMRGESAPNLRKWIQPPVFVLPEPEYTRCGSPVGAFDGRGGTARSRRGTLTQWTPDNSPERKRVRSVTRQDLVSGAEFRRKRSMFGDGHPTRREHRHRPVTGNVGGPGQPVQKRYSLADAIRLQGLPENLLDECPWTADGKLQAVANGVPIPMGRAIAKAVRKALQA